MKSRSKLPIHESLKTKRLDPSTIRNYIDLEKFDYSNDWSRGLAGIKQYNRYNAGTREHCT